MTKLKILNSVTDEEAAAITAAIIILSGKIPEPETEIFSKWKNSSRRNVERNGSWKLKSCSLWQI